MASELGRLIAKRYSDVASLCEILKKVPPKILAKVGESAGDYFLEKGSLECAFEAYIRSGNLKKLLSVGDKALEEGRIHFTIDCYKKAGSQIDGERKDILEFLEEMR
jgi:hypothetical protein